MRLIDADALKKDWSMANKCEECPQDARKCQYEQNFSRMDICEMLDEAPTVGGWISVKDRLPEKETLVIALVQYEVGWYRIFAWRDDKGWVSSAEEFQESDGDYVTHWMPLPERPKEDGNESD